MEQNTLWMTEEATLANKANRQKGTVMGSIALVVFAIGVCVCIALYWHDFAFYFAEFFGFLAVGSLHVYRLNRQEHINSKERWIFTGSLAVMIFIFFAFFFYWQNRFLWLLIFPGPCAFLLPFFLAESFRLYQQLSFAGAIPWQPTTELQQTNPDIYLNPFPLRFKVNQCLPGKKNTVVDVSTSRRMKVGEIFCDMTQKQKKQGVTEIDLTDESGTAYRWIFLTREFLLWQRPLDPNLTLLQNNVRENAVLYAYRVEARDDDTHPEENPA